jgi:excisionase family DNA binding protein
MSDRAKRQAKTKRKPRRITDGTTVFGEPTAARKLGVSYPTIFRLRKAGEIPFYRIGNRVLYDDRCLAEFLERSRRPAA